MRRRLANPALAVPAPPVSVAPSAYEGANGSGLVFFIGLVGFDFGTEARRDTFKQQMRPVLANPSTLTIWNHAEHDG